MTLEIDHVIVCLPDLGDAVVAFETTHGVVSVAGGRHQGHGTANRIVPLGAEYIELVSVVDEDEAARSPFGMWVGDRARRPGADGVSIRTDDLDSVCSRLDLDPLAMSRDGPGGTELRWRIAGLDQLVAYGLPFFIEWNIPPGLHPGRIAVEEPRGTATLKAVTVTGDVDLLEHWVAGTLALAIEDGEPGARFTLEKQRL